MLHSMSAGPDLWPDKDKAPWDSGDSDGGPVGQPNPFQHNPGDSINQPPTPSPDNDFG